MSTGGHHHDPDHLDPTHSRIDAQLVSIGMDIGSATSHFVLSELVIGRRDVRVATKPDVLHRRLLFESPVIMTPYVNHAAIDAEALERFIRQETGDRGIDLDAVDTGAVICTGEAARKQNAAKISERLSSMIGDFVCAAAGHALEATLGAHGSGAVEASRTRTEPIVLLDVGGGTAKRSVISRGRILQTAALNVGTRLIAFDPTNNSIDRLEGAGLDVARAVGIEPRLGYRLLAHEQRALADRFAECLVQYLGLRPMDSLTSQLVLTPPLEPLPERFTLALTGGLSEYFFDRSGQGTGDVGLFLADSFREALSEFVAFEDVLELDTGLRATVIGAGQFSLTVSGATVFADGRLVPPLKGVPVRFVEIDWADVSAETIERRIGDSLFPEDAGGLCALSFPDGHPGFGVARDLAAALAVTLPRLPIAGTVLVFPQNIARTVGEALWSQLSDFPFICIDEVNVSTLDFIDVGKAVDSNDFLPIVVKSLAFA